MKKNIFLLMVIIGSSCAMKNYSQMKPGQFYLSEVSDFEDFNDAIIKKAVAKSKTKLFLNEETGEFEGEMNGISFSGNFEFGRTSAGFVKGFYIASQLGYLKSDKHEDKQFDVFTSKLAKTKRLYIYNDNMLAAKWVVMEVSFAEGEKLTFISKK